ncbi:MAG: glycosyltransferase [Bacteroidaceae bacterium]|nr:glycosyltransferase [Bacteroidaceae bacterium]
MFKLFQINSTYNWGSTGRIAEEIGQIVIKQGGKSYLAYGRYHNNGLSKAIHIGNKLEFYNHVLQSRLFDKHGLSSKNATKELIKQLETIQPTIIHLHNIHGYYLNYPILFNYIEKANIPIVWTLHDCWSFTGHCAYFDYINCNKWKKQCHDCKGLNTYPKAFIDSSQKNFSLKKQYLTQIPNMVLVPVSNWLDRLVSESFLSHYKTHVIHNGINIDLFKPTIDETIFKKYNINNKFIILGLTNIWAERKGLNDIIKLNEIIDHSVFQIVLVGLTTKQIKQIPQSIIGIPRTDSIQDLVKLYSHAGVFINPTWEDNFPTTNLEALACGTPVITYNTGGSPEAINEETGYVVPKGDIDNLYEAIKNVYNGYIDRKDCRNRAVRLYNKEDRFQEYINLYKSLL